MIKIQINIWDIPYPEDLSQISGQHHGLGHNGSACKWSVHVPAAAAGRRAAHCCHACKRGIWQSSAKKILYSTRYFICDVYIYKLISLLFLFLQRYESGLKHMILAYKYNAHR